MGTADIFGNYFCSIVQNLSIPVYPSVLNNLSDINSNLAEIFMKQFKDHPSIKRITNTINKTAKLSSFYYFKSSFKRIGETKF